MFCSARAILAAAALAAALPVALGGCSSTSPMSAIGSITGGSSIPETDRVFLMAAGSWDRNRDNAVTCDEWKAYAAELFSGADVNRDDALDATEWPRGMTGVERIAQTLDDDPEISLVVIDTLQRFKAGAESVLHAEDTVPALAGAGIADD